jgi:small conductance mechanosensitive channel
VDLVAQLSHGTDHRTAIPLLKERLGKIPNVLSQPVPDVEILQFNLAGPVLAVRPYCHNDHYWQVYFDTNRLIRESFGEAGLKDSFHNFIFGLPLALLDPLAVNGLGVLDVSRGTLFEVQFSSDA